MERLLDGSALLVTALICALLAWCFWHFLGQNAFDVFALLFMFSLLGENYLLRKELNRFKNDDSQNSTEG